MKLSLQSWRLHNTQRLCLLHQGVRADRSQRPKRLAPACKVRLYTNPKSRGRIVEWWLKELAIPYEAINVNLEKGENMSEEYLEINPMGKLPGLVDGDFRVWESGALLLYLADKYGGSCTAAERAIAAQWTLFANSTMANAIFIEQYRNKQLPVVMNALERQLSRTPWLMGAAFSVADVAVGGYLLYIPIFFPSKPLDEWPAVQDYINRLKQRDECLTTVLAQLFTQEEEEEESGEELTGSHESTSSRDGDERSSGTRDGEERDANNNGTVADKPEVDSEAATGVVEPPPFDPLRID